MLKFSELWKTVKFFSYFLIVFLQVVASFWKEVANSCQYPTLSHRVNVVADHQTLPTALWVVWLHAELRALGTVLHAHAHRKRRVVPSRWYLIFSTVSRTLNINFILALMIMWEDFISYSYCERITFLIIVSHLRIIDVVDVWIFKFWPG